MARTPARPVCWILIFPSWMQCEQSEPSAVQYFSESAANLAWRRTTRTLELDTCAGDTGSRHGLQWQGLSDTAPLARYRHAQVALTPILFTLMPRA
jgi:hypothetical protein